MGKTSVVRIINFIMRRTCWDLTCSPLPGLRVLHVFLDGGVAILLQVSRWVGLIRQHSARRFIDRGEDVVVFKTLSRALRHTLLCENREAVVPLHFRPSQKHPYPVMPDVPDQQRW